jgi:hypothetical protein
MRSAGGDAWETCLVLGGGTVTQLVSLQLPLIRSKSGGPAILFKNIDKNKKYWLYIP